MYFNKVPTYLHTGGEVDVSRDSSLGGSYSRLSPMELLWSMQYLDSWREGGMWSRESGERGGGLYAQIFIKMYFKFRWTMIFFLRRKGPSLNLTSSRSADMLCKRRNPTSSFTNGKWQREDKTIDQFRYIKIQPNTIDLRTRLWE